MIRSRLASLMADHGVRQDKLHEDTGISRATLSNIANNKTSAPQYSTLSTLAIYFGVTPNELIDFVPYDYNLEIPNEIKIADDFELNERNLFIEPDDVANVHYVSGAFLHIKGKELKTSVVDLFSEIYVKDEFRNETTVGFPVVTTDFNYFLTVALQPNDAQKAYWFYQALGGDTRKTPAFQAQFMDDLTNFIKESYAPVFEQLKMHGKVLMIIGDNHVQTTFSI